MNHKQIAYRNLGLADYQATWDLQESLFSSTVARKIANRKLKDGEEKQLTENHLLVCGHHPVFTLGKSGKLDHLLLSKEALANRGIQFFKINRGGDITFHGPGQIVGYPILDLAHFKEDIGWYMRSLEEVVIRTIAEYGLKGERSPGETGVWLDVGTPRARKICALGVRTSRWTTMHGWAFNVNTNLDYFKMIVPCGIQDKGVTSLHTELGVEEVDKEEVLSKLLQHFQAIFEAEFISAP